MGNEATGSKIELSVPEGYEEIKIGFDLSPIYEKLKSIKIELKEITYPDLDYIHEKIVDCSGHREYLVDLNRLCTKEKTRLNLLAIVIENRYEARKDDKLANDAEVRAASSIDDRIAKINVSARELKVARDLVKANLLAIKDLIQVINTYKSMVDAIREDVKQQQRLVEAMIKDMNFATGSSSDMKSTTEAIRAAEDFQRRHQNNAPIDPGFSDISEEYSAEETAAESLESDENPDGSVSSPFDDEFTEVSVDGQDHTLDLDSTETGDTGGFVDLDLDESIDNEPLSTMDLDLNDSINHEPAAEETSFAGEAPVEAELDLDLDLDQGIADSGNQDGFGFAETETTPGEKVEENLSGFSDLDVDNSVIEIDDKNQDSKDDDGFADFSEMLDVPEDEGEDSFVSLDLDLDLGDDSEDEFPVKDQVPSKSELQGDDAEDMAQSGADRVAFAAEEDSSEGTLGVDLDIDEQDFDVDSFVVTEGRPQKSEAKLEVEEKAIVEKPVADKKTNPAKDEDFDPQIDELLSAFDDQF